MVTEFPIAWHGNLTDLGFLDGDFRIVRWGEGVGDLRIVSSSGVDEGFPYSKFGLAQYDTSAIGTDTITKVEVFRSLASTDITADLSYTVAEVWSELFTFPAWIFRGVEVFDWATVERIARTESAPYTNNIWLDLGALGVAHVNKTGLTTLYFRKMGQPDAIWNDATTPCVLRVTHAAYVPPDSQQLPFARVRP